MSLDEARPAGAPRPDLRRQVVNAGILRGRPARCAAAIASQPRSRQATGGVRPAGEEMHLAKPLDPEELLATVAEVAGRGVPPASGA